MSFRADVFRAMIASPSDVAAERQVIRDVISEWTAVHSVDKAAVLLPVAWESHSAPEMGDRPQGIINKRLLKDCDLLVAAFWTRVGSPTGAAVSGTVEEIEEHISAGKAVMIYFSQAPVRPDSVDVKQYELLKAFRERCRSRGLFETYDSLSEFREKLSRQLALTMIRLAGDGESDRDGGRQTPAQSDATLPKPVALSTQAAILLKKAAEVGQGRFLRLVVLGGNMIQVNTEVLNTQSDMRDTARWEAAIEELERSALVRATGPKREIFELTNRGFDAADVIAV